MYTSGRGVSLRRVAWDVARVLTMQNPTLEAIVFDEPKLTYEDLENCDACISVMTFDLVWGLPYFLVAAMYRYYRKPSVFYTTIEGGVRRGLVRNWVLRDLVYVANSGYTKSKLEEVNARVLAVVPHGVDVDTISNYRGMREEIRSKLGVDGKVVVGYVAQGHFRKCHDLFSKVVKSVLSRAGDVAFLILTDRAGVKYYEGSDALVIPAFGELDNATYYGLLHSMDVYAQGSCSEGFGLPVLEALACGKPVIHPDYPPLTEVTTPDCSVRVPTTQTESHGLDSSGIIYELKRYDPEVFAKALLTLVNEVRGEGTPRGKLMSWRARERAKAFDSSRVYPTLLKLLQGR